LNKDLQDNQAKFKKKKIQIPKKIINQVNDSGLRKVTGFGRKTPEAIFWAEFLRICPVVSHRKRAGRWLEKF
jgi:hypothetical protein